MGNKYPDEVPAWAEHILVESHVNIVIRDAGRHAGECVG